MEYPPAYQIIDKSVLTVKYWNNIETHPVVTVLQNQKHKWARLYSN